MTGLEWIGVFSLPPVLARPPAMPAARVRSDQSVLLYGMSHDGTVVAVVPVLVIRMLTSDNQRCAEALESATRKHQNFGCKVRGATWCYRKCGSRWTEARVCILLFSNVEGEVCLDRKLHGALQRGGGARRWRRTRRRKRSSRRREDYVFDRTSRSALWRERDLVSNFSAGVQHAVTLRR
jgi:hypothetical protein